LRANGARECAPDDRLREAIQKPKQDWIASSLALLAMTPVESQSAAKQDHAPAFCCEISTRPGIAIIVDDGMLGVGSQSLHLLQIIPMDGLYIAAAVELDAPTARGSLSDNETLPLAVFGMPLASPRAHSHAITDREQRSGL
jgi:hypothetical protein